MCHPQVVQSKEGNTPGRIQVKPSPFTDAYLENPKSHKQPTLANKHYCNMSLSVLQIWKSLKDQKAFLVFYLLDPRRQAVILLLCVDAPTLMDKMSGTIGPQSDINPNRTKIYPLPTVCLESISVRDDYGIDLRSVSAVSSEKSLVLVDRAPEGVVSHVHQCELKNKIYLVCVLLTARLKPLIAVGLAAQYKLY